MFLQDLLAPTHLIVILIVALVVVGPKRLPEMGRSLGRGLREFKESIGGSAETTNDHVEASTVRPANDSSSSQGHASR